MATGDLIYDLKTPESKKTEEWYREIIDHLVPYDTSVVSSYDKMKRNYDLINNNLQGYEYEYRQFCKRFSQIYDLPEQLDDDLVPFNRIFSKFSYLVGQLLQRNDKYETILLSDHAHKEKEAEFLQALQDSMNELVELETELAQLKLQGASESELERHAAKMATQPQPEDIDQDSFMSKSEEFYHQIIEYFNYKFNVKDLKTIGFKHVVCTDQCAFAVVEQFGKPVPIALNPLHYGFHKSPDIFNFDEGDWFYYKQAITVADAYDEIGHLVTEEQIEQLATLTGSTRYRAKRTHAPGSPDSKLERSHFTYHALRESSDTFDKNVGQSMGSGTNRKYNSERLIWKTHLWFKAYRQVMFLSWIDEYGKEIVKVVPSNFEIPKDASKVKFRNRYGRDSSRFEWIDSLGVSYYAEKMWIPRWYQCQRYGSDLIVNFMEVPFQSVNIDDPYGACRPPVVGGIFTSLNSEPISLVERAVASQFMYFLVKNLQMKELAKYEGFILAVDTDQTADDIAEDEEGNELFEGVDKEAIADWVRRRLGRHYFSGSQTSNGLYNPQKGPPITAVQLGNFLEIANMQEFVKLVDEEIGLQMLVPPQAEGIVAQNSNVGDNRMALNQGYVMAEPYYSKFSQVMQRLVSEYVRQFREYYKRFFKDNPDVTETFLSYITPDGTKKLLTITPEYLDHEDIGIFMYDATQNDVYRRYMEQVGHALAQNRAEGADVISSIFMSLARGDSPVTVHKKIVKLSEMQQQRLERIEQIRGQASKETEQMKREIEELKIRLQGEEDIKQIVVTKEYDKELKAMEGDADEIPKQLETTKVVQEDH